MRYESVVQLLGRRAKSEEAVTAGTPISRGDFVYLLTGAARRDPAAFSDPLTFDPERKAKQHIGFGYGFHVCLGMNLARLESNLFFTRFFKEIPEFTMCEVDYGDNWEGRTGVSNSASSLRRTELRCARKSQRCLDLLRCTW
jgi:cytochrome P450